MLGLTKDGERQWVEPLCHSFICPGVEKLNAFNRVWRYHCCKLLSLPWRDLNTADSSAISYQGVKAKQIHLSPPAYHCYY